MFAPDKENATEIVLILNYLTSENKLVWEESDSETYLFETEWNGWNVFLGPKPEESTVIAGHTVNYFLTIEDPSGDHFVRLDDQSAVNDLNDSIRIQLDIQEVSDTILLEKFLKQLNQKTDYNI